MSITGKSQNITYGYKQKYHFLRQNNSIKLEIGNSILLDDGLLNLTNCLPNLEHLILSDCTYESTFSDVIILPISALNTCFENLHFEINKQNEEMPLVFISVIYGTYQAFYHINELGEMEKSFDDDEWDETKVLYNCRTIMLLIHCKSLKTFILHYFDSYEEYTLF
jgi:hypothetical protein